MPRLKLIVLLAATTALTACASIKEAVNGPTLSPMSHPVLPPLSQDVASIAAASPDPPPQPASPNSLWRTGARAFFNDQRASKVGDILTVLINIDDSAKTQNATTTSKTSTNSAGVANLFGLEKLITKAFNPATAINTNTSLVAGGTGGITRQEQITLTIAAVVTKVLPNGNLVIDGTQEMRTDDDTRVLTVEGIVRPQDITSTNTILHTQIAEARISYAGRGDIEAVQKVAPGTALLQRFAPF